MTSLLGRGFVSSFRRRLDRAVAPAPARLVSPLAARSGWRSGAVAACVLALTFAAGLPVTRAASSSAPVAAAQAQPAREHLNFDADWRFAFGNPVDPARDFGFATSYFSYLAKDGYGDGPAAADFDDRGWRRLNLPHDWAVEAPFDPRASASHGFKAIGRNFPDRTIGWYRKSFVIPASDLGRRISIEFDGVFRDAQVWVNGFYLGRHASGYTGFHYDLTNYLNYGGRNVVTVRVNATMEEGWFYEGAGIYRHVWLTKTAPLHVAHWGVAVRTAVGGPHATVEALTTVANASARAATFDLEQQVIDPDGRLVAAGACRAITVGAGERREIPCRVNVAQPRLWSLEAPNLYHLRTTVRVGGAVVDRYTTPFGIRTLRFDPNHGFFLNGRHVEIHGANLHQDFAGVGVALPDALQAFRIRRLQAFGVNAIRCAHNPPNPALLAACDRLGMLVLDENRAFGDSPPQLRELGSMIRRDRNHPSVILWSIGNEEWAVEGNVKGARIANAMQAYAHRLDPTRRVTYANSGGWGGISTVIDVVGYNYIHQSNPDEQHARFPLQPGLGTEESTTQGTRGIYFDDRAHAHLAPLAHGDSGGNCEIGWKYYAARPFLAGVFFWTGFDYRGEPTPFGWPAISSQFGILDTCGFPKDSAYYLKSWWTDAPVLHLYPHWNWPGRVGQVITVGCDSNDDAVELLRNGVSLGRKTMPRNGHLEWPVRYEPGVLEARGYRAGRLVQTERIETTGAPARLVLTPDRSVIRADGTDVAVFTVSALDAQGRAVPTAANEVHFAVDGGRILGVGNGDPGSHERDSFVPDYALGTLTDWRGRIAAAAEAAPADPAELRPLDELGRWRAPLPKPGEVYQIAAAFDVRAPAPDARVTLFLPSFGARMTVWVNGHELVRDVDTTRAGPAVPLTRADLVPGRNVVRLRVQPTYDGRDHIPETANFGCVQVVTPPPPPKRRLFNGLAAVIVQSTRTPGPIVLRATANGLQPAESTVRAAAAGLR